MCARIFYLLLASLFGFVIITVAAFKYLEWWQAILTSGLTFLMIVMGLKYLFKSMLGSLGEMFKGTFDAKSKVLRDATVDVHHVRVTSPPEEVTRVADDPDADEFDRAEAAADLQNLRWYEVEVTIFPDRNQESPMKHWDLDDLRLVPADATPKGVFESGADDDTADFELHQLRVIEDGEAFNPDDTKPEGPCRIRFVAGLPAQLREAKFQYYFEHFGSIRLPAGPALL